MSEVHRRLEYTSKPHEEITRIPLIDFAIMTRGPDVVSLQNRFAQFQRDIAKEPVVTAEGPVPATVSVHIYQAVASERLGLPIQNILERYPRKRATSAENVLVVHSLDDQDARDSMLQNRENAFEIANALTEDRVRIALQPIVRADDPSQILSRECLVRVVLPGGDLMPMTSLVSGINSLGFSRHLDRRVLDLAALWLLRHPHERLSVNISPQTFADQDWFDRFESFYKHNPDIVHRMIIEIIEATAISDSMLACERVAFIQNCGARVALDDFGVGFLSFGHLRDLKPDMLKIDGSYVRGLPHDTQGAAFVTAIATLAQHLGIQLVAEMASDGEALAFLREQKIEYLQGYGFGVPELWEHGLKDWSQ
ncbi:EAL domain-containing protein [uncultured Ruegeria sp.]|uniref:EAL domain-containing protein n=1 Tax=uncultured Ruegeria sp. TaxID=259304 RepID=UPI00263404CF|nr:EAL domain-containing protein [uncultured Ruegeria sp.]